MSTLPVALYRAHQIREIEQAALSQGTTERSLMRAAGEAAYRELLSYWPKTTHLEVFCGSGNNAGDGYVVASLASQRGLNVRIWWVSCPSKLTGPAARAYQVAKQSVTMAEFSPGCLSIQEPNTVLVDGLLGIGLQGPVKPSYAAAINEINALSCPVLSLDIPSGIDPDTGAGECCIKATVTVSFVAQKLGLTTGQGLIASGQRHLADLGIHSDIPPVAHRIYNPLDHLNSRAPNTHKGEQGRVLVIGGDHGYGGAGIMTAEMALLAGTGLVGLATRAQHCVAMLSRHPQIMAQAIDSGQALVPLLDKADVLALGPGLGLEAWGSQLCFEALRADKPMVIDADALNLLASNSQLASHREQWVLTPHPGEAARLLNCSIADIEADRVAAAISLHTKWGGVVVLKGAGTVVTDGRDVFVCDIAAPALASGGMGDVLTGLIASLYAQGHSALDAALMAVHTHATAGVLLGVRTGHRGVLAQELSMAIREQINQACTHKPTLPASSKVCL